MTFSMGASPPLRDIESDKQIVQICRHSDRCRSTEHEGFGRCMKRHALDRDHRSDDSLINQGSKHFHLLGVARKCLCWRKRSRRTNVPSLLMNFANKSSSGPAVSNSSSSPRILSAMRFPNWRTISRTLRKRSPTAFWFDRSRQELRMSSMTLE